MKTPWSHNDWREIELLSNELVVSAHEMSERVGSGGAAVSGDDIRASISQIEAVLANLKQTVANYN